MKRRSRRGTGNGRRLAAAMLAVATAAVVAPNAGAPAASAVVGCSTSWKTPGVSGVFNRASNWTAGVPTKATDACLPASATGYTVTAHRSGRARGLIVNTGATLRLESTPGVTVTLAIGTGGVNNDGTIELVNTGPELHATTLSVKPAANLENNGILRVLPSNAVRQVVAATLHNTTNGALDIGGETELTRFRNDGFATVAAHTTLEVQTLDNFDAGTQTLTGGTFDVSGTLLVPGLRVATLAAGVAINGGGSVIDTDLTVDSFQPLETITTAGSLAFGDGASFSFTHSVVNQGRFLVGNDVTITTGGDYTQAGVYTSLSPGSHLQTTDGTVFLTAGDIVGEGTITAPVVNSGGTLFPAPQIVIDNDYTQKKGGTIAVRVDGTPSSGKVVVTGTATLSGTLSMTAAAPLTPTIGSTYDVLTANALVHQFTNPMSDGFTDPAVPYAFVPGYTGGSVFAEVVADYDDDHPAVTYGGWHGVANSNTSGGTYRYACTQGETASFAFSGPSITWNTYEGTDKGLAQVFVDGADKGVIDLYATTNAPLKKHLTNLGAGAHTLLIEVLGVRNSSSTDACVVVDGFKVGTITTEDTSRAISWTRWTGVSGGTGLHLATAAGAQAEIAGVMDGVEWITRTGPDGGKARVLIDGTPAFNVNLYSPQVKTGVRVLVPTSRAVHAVTIVALGKHDPASTGTVVAVDELIVF